MYSYSILLSLRSLHVLVQYVETLLVLYEYILFYKTAHSSFIFRPLSSTSEQRSLIAGSSARPS
jgi:hypothetical protein